MFLREQKLASRSVHGCTLLEGLTYSAILIYSSGSITLLIKIKGLSKNFSFWTVSLDLDATALIIFGAVALLHTSYVHAF